MPMPMPMPTPIEQGSDDGGCVVTIGTYDGVHLGHRALIEETRREAARAGLRSAVVTFDRHPAEVIRPEVAPQLLTGLAHKVELLEATGIDRVIVLGFDAARAAQSAEDFVEQLLVGEIGARAVVVGANFRFGHRQRGDIALLERMAVPLSLHVHAIGLLTGERAHRAVSSAGIRKLVSAGELDEAARLLGRPHEVRGELQLEEARAGVVLSPRLLLPPPGRYHALVGPPGRPDRDTVVTVRADCRALALGEAPPLATGDHLAVRFLELIDPDAPRRG
jgi:riboflavin kinase/FMN adenylyltransferase